MEKGRNQYERAATPDIGEERRREAAAANEKILAERDAARDAAARDAASDAARAAANKK